MRTSPVFTAVSQSQQSRTWWRRGSTC